MSLKGIAKATLQIITDGQYTAPSGAIIQFKTKQQAAEKGTKLYRPDELLELLQAHTAKEKTQPIIQVTNETTQVAAHRLVQLENCNDLVLLNYASAKKPGGGFINGAKAQEEDLARCSGLYPCLLAQTEYYEKNRQKSSMLYTDYLIYTPNVPWFRTCSRDLLDQIFLASVITAPAPNAGQAWRQNVSAQQIEATLRQRAGMVLSIAHTRGHRTLLLGAWGCGVFGNDPIMVADAFGRWLESNRFLGCFDRIVFAVYDPSKQQQSLHAFEERFANQ